ncbi:MAG: hypothetical protein F4X59_07720 [Holophagales bacterium]|nr:hypothetical protein [Holophagales bacterium]
MDRAPRGAVEPVGELVPELEEDGFAEGEFSKYDPQQEDGGEAAEIGGAAADQQPPAPGSEVAEAVELFADVARGGRWSGRKCEQ